MTFEIIKENNCYLLKELQEHNFVYIILMDGDYNRYSYPYPDKDLEEIVKKIENSRLFSIFFKDILDNFQSVIFTLNYGNTFEFEVNI